MPEYCQAKGRRGDYRLRIYRQGIRFIKENGPNNDNILLLSHLTERTFSDVLLDLLREENNV